MLLREYPQTVLEFPGRAPCVSYIYFELFILMWSKPLV